MARNLTLNERITIQNELDHKATKAAIGRKIGKDKSSIGREIKAHRFLSYQCKLSMECAVYRNCTHGRNCSSICPDLVLFSCARRDRSPGVCNGCEKIKHCRFNKYRYKATQADEEYRHTLVASRAGVNLTKERAIEIGKLVAPLIRDKKQSPYMAITNHPELGITEKTLYNYIHTGVFTAVGIDLTDIHLRRKVSRKITKKVSAGYKPRKDKKYLIDRTYKDYLQFIEVHSNVRVLQMDTVYNDVSNGPFIQTFKFIGLGVMIAIFHETKDAETMTKGIEILDEALGKKVFSDFAEVILTDRGTEFTDVYGSETRPDGSPRTKVFFCDPMRSNQKGSLEVNHQQLRYFFKKGAAYKNLRALGLVSQKALNLAISHINSMPLKSLNGKSAFEYIEFMAPPLWKKLQDFGLCRIPKDDVTLSPDVFLTFFDEKEGEDYGIYPEKTIAGIISSDTDGESTPDSDS